MKDKQLNIVAFIDAQNLYLGIRDLGWELDYKRFRKYLSDKYGVSKTYLFIGYIPENDKLYEYLWNVGFILCFKTLSLSKNKNHKPKGNVDVDIVLKAMIEYTYYDQSIIITADGDFAPLVSYLGETNKLKTVLAPNRVTCSKLLEVAARGRISYFDRLRNKLEKSIKMKKHR